MPALPPTTPLPVASRAASTRDEVEVLLTVLHGERVFVGVTEAIRIHHVLSLGPEVDEAGLVQLVACLVARTSEQRVAVERAVRLWFRSEEPKVAREAGLQQVFHAPVAEPARRPEPVETREEAPLSRRSLPGEPLADVPSPARREALLALLRTDRGLTVLGATAGVMVLGGLVIASLLRAVPSGSEGLAGRLVALLVGGGVGLTVLRTARYTKALAAPGARSDRQADLDLPAPPFHLKGPVLLDARAQQDVIDGLGTHVTEQLTRELDTRATIHASAQAAGLPILIHRTFREVRTVWLWIDESARGGLLERAAFELQSILRRGGIPVEIALFPAVPSPSDLYRASFAEDGRIRGPHPRLSPGEMAEEPEGVVIAVLTDGHELSIAARGGRAKEAARGLAALRRYPRLAFIDFGRERTDLPYLAERHRLLHLPPEDLPAFLAGDGVKGVPVVEHGTRLYGNERLWAAVCALSPRPVDTATALALRSFLGLQVEPWGLQRLLASSSLPGCVAFGPEDRARLLLWLTTSEVDGDGRQDPPDRPTSTLGRARKFWRAHHAENAIDQALLDLWEMPGGEGDRLAKAVDVLYDWSKTRPGQRGNSEVKRHAPRPEGDRPVSDCGGKILLPWRWSELAEYPEIRMRLRELGLGRIAEEPAPERWRLPGTVALSLGLAGGVAASALATMTASLPGVLLAAGTVPAAVYLGVRWWQKRVEPVLAILNAEDVAQATTEREEGPESQLIPDMPAPVDESASEGESTPGPPDAPDVEPEGKQITMLSEDELDVAPVALRGAALSEVVTGAVQAPVPPPPPTPRREPRVTLPMDLVELPGGRFWMGSRDDDPRASDNEKPRHRVEVGAFAIGRYPVTQAHYAAVMGANPGEPKGVALPVNNVSWADAVQFCNRLSEREGLRPAYAARKGKDGLDVTRDQEADGYRLPTEAEWEYAARGGTETAWSFGDDEALLGEHAWYAKNSDGQMQPVGEKKPNPNGMHDVHGNVWEWCLDWYGRYVSSPDPRVNPVAPPAGGDRVLRGGSWDDGPRRLRSASRLRGRPTGRSRSVGFRCVRAVPRQHGR